MIKRIININVYFICLLIVLQLNGLYYYVEPYSTVFKISIISETILIFLFCLKSYIINIKKVIKYLIVFGVYFLILFITSQKYIILVFDLLVILNFIWYTYINKINIFDYISNIIVGLALISIILYLIFPILNMSSPTNYYSPFNNNVIYHSFYDIFFTSQKLVINGIYIPRNGFIFTEPGAFSLYLNFSFIYETVKNKKVLTKKNLIVAIAIFTTTSTLGYFILCVFTSINLILGVKDKTKIQKVIYTLILIFIVGLLSILAYKIYYNKVNYGGNSANVRRDDARIGLLLFKKKVLFGWGYSNWGPMTSMQDSILRKGDIGGHTNGLVNILYCGGIYLAIIYIFTVYNFILKSLKNNKRSILILLYLLIQTYIFPIQFSYFMYVFIIAGSINYNIDGNIESRDFIINKTN